MKKFVLAALLGIIAWSPVYAATAVIDAAPTAEMRLDSTTSNDLASPNQNDLSFNAGNIIGGIVAGAAGFIAAEELERLYPYHQGEFACFARNARGTVFEARGFFPRRVQWRALGQCESVSAYCRAEGCRRIGW